jgi:hypothetical protein
VRLAEQAASGGRTAYPHRRTRHLARQLHVNKRLDPSTAK